MEVEAVRVAINKQDGFVVSMLMRLSFVCVCVCVSSACCFPVQVLTEKECPKYGEDDYEEVSSSSELRAVCFNTVELTSHCVP